MKSIFSFRTAFAAMALAAVTTFACPATAADDDAKAKPAAKAAAKAAAKPVAKAVAKVRPLSITATLLGATKLTGTLMDTTALEMRTSFGVANIPLSEVAGIRFASADNASTTVVMLNGDSITGATDVKLVTIETEWGTAAVNGQNIESILFVPGLVWSSSDGLNGKRWVLSETKSPKASTSTAQRAASPSPARTNAPSQSLPSPNINGNSITYPNNSFPNNFGN